MKILNKDSCTTQIVKYLEGEILSGALPPFSKLKPIRELAEKFGVSSTLVLAAFKELEKRRLIYREERRGVFVSPMGRRPKMREIFILVFGDDPDRSAFIRQILSIMSFKEVLGKINFGLRVVTFSNEDMDNHQLTHEMLKAEIARLIPSLHADAILIAGPKFLYEDVKSCLELPFKMIFLGNFQEGDFADLRYNRLGFIARSFETFAMEAIGKKIQHAVLVVPEMLRSAEYFIAARKRAEVIAEKNGFSIHTVFLEHFGCANENLLETGRRKALAEALKYRPEMIFLDCVRYIDFKNVLNEFQLENNPSIKLYFQGQIRHETLHYPSNVRLIDRSQKDMDEFNARLNTLLNELCEGNLDNHREDFLSDSVNIINQER